MAVSVASYSGDLHAPRWLRHDIGRPNTHLYDTRELLELDHKIKVLVSVWKQVKAGKRSTFDLFRPCRTVRQNALLPYLSDNEASELPTDFTATNALARCSLNKQLGTPGSEHPTCRRDFRSCAQSIAKSSADVDFSSIEGIRTHAGKKAKKAAKAAQQAKWADSDDDGNGDGAADGGEGGDSNGGGDAGAGGDGGDGGDGAGDDDWWNTGNSKKDKKKKKKGWADIEEEEEEKRKKEEEEAAAGTNGDAAADDWGSFATVGKKKNKKGAAVQFEPEPEPVASLDLGATAGVEANLDDEWATTKKGKKGKKGKVCASYSILVAFALAWLDDDHVLPCQQP